MGTKGNPHENNVGLESDSDDSSESSSASSSNSETEWSGNSSERSKQGPKTRRLSRTTTPRRAARSSRLPSSHSHTPQQFSVTASGDTGLKLKIAAIPAAKHLLSKPSQEHASKVSPTKPKIEQKPRKVKQKKKSILSESSSSSETSCSDFSSSEDTDSETNAKKKSVKSKVQSKATPKLSATVSCKADESNSEVRSESVVSESPALADSKSLKCSKNEVNSVKCSSDNKKTRKESEEKPSDKTPVKRVRGRPQIKAGVSGADCVSSSSSSSASGSSSSSSSSSDSDSADSAGGSPNGSSDDSSAALAAACSLQVIDDEDLAALLPEQGATTQTIQNIPPAGAPTNTTAQFTTFVQPTHNADDDKSVQDTGDGSSSEMEIPAQLVTAAIQRATADSSGSENECSNPGVSQTSATHYASSLLQQFVAQTQLLNHSASISTINPVVNNLVGNQLENVPSLNDCILPEIPTIATSFLADEHLTSTDTQHLSPQQTEELRQINKDLAEITSHSESMCIPNPATLDNCVDSTDYIPLSIPQSSSDFTSDNVKSSPVLLSDDIANVAILVSSDKDDFNNVNANESQEDSKSIIAEDIKRKRGRPRKSRDQRNTKINTFSKDSNGNIETSASTNNNGFCLGNDPPNVSPDSGILSNHNSPTHSPIRKGERESNHPNKSKSSKCSLKDTARSSRSTSKIRSRGRSKTRDRSISSEASFKRKPLFETIRLLKVESPSPTPSKQNDRIKKSESKLDISALDRMLYATDRVLYPPRRKVGRPPQNKNLGKKGPGRPAKNKCVDSVDSDSEINANRSVLSEVYTKRKDLNKLAALTKKGSKNMSNWREQQSDVEALGDDPLDPTWQQIDLNPKYKDILSGYKSDHDIRPFRSCSRLLESGYKSDFGFRSGYKSDHGCKSGYKTDHRSGYKSDKSGYKSDHSIRNIRKRMRKMKKSRSVRDRSYYKNQKYFVTDQEILLLANKTFSCLALGHSTSDSDSDFHSRNNSKEVKFQSACNKFRNLSVGAKFGFVSSNYFNNSKSSACSTPDPFAPGPVFSAFNARIPSSSMNLNLFQTSSLKPFFSKPDKHLFGGSPVLGNSSVFVHKFACSPITNKKKDDHSIKVPFVQGIKKDIVINNNTLKHFAQNTSPKSKKTAKSTDSSSAMCKREKSPPLVNVFEKARNLYVPNKSLSRNVFLNIKKPQKKSMLPHKKKHKKQNLLITPTKINLKGPRISRISTPLSQESKHQKHKQKRHKRSRSLSRPRDLGIKQSVDNIDPKFIEEMDNLVNHFVKFCHIVPKSPPEQIVKSIIEKSVTESTPKSIKRISKKRKGSENNEVSTPTSKRRHKKQQAESQAKGSKDKDTSANEHKLPLKKRHYHINCSTNSTLSLSFVSSEFGENFKSENSRPDDAFECTETNCLVDMKDSVSTEKSNSTPKCPTKSTDKHKKLIDNSKSPGAESLSTHSDNVKLIQIDKDIKQKAFACEHLSAEPKSDENENVEIVHSVSELEIDIQIEKPIGEPSELSKKIIETSEKLKAVHKMVHDLEKSLPKIKDVDTKKENDVEESRTDVSKVVNTTKESPKTEAKSASSPDTNSKTSPAPIVTPKKRHRLEADKIISNSPLDQVVQILTKKLSEDKVLTADKEKVETKSSHSSPMRSQDMENKKFLQNEIIKKEVNTTVSDPAKALSTKTLNKNTIHNKSDIMTRKKIRLEGLTSNLVSKINPVGGPKMLDNLMNSNLRKSIESKIHDKTKETIVEVGQKFQEDKSKIRKESTNSTPRATVIKSPISRTKLPAEAKKLPKGTDILIEETVVMDTEKPTGIFEPSVDIELQIPKSSIPVHASSEMFNKSQRPIASLKSTEKLNAKASKISSLNHEQEQPLTLPPAQAEMGDLSPRKRSESIASLICDKIQESGHNLRHSKRNNINDDKKSEDPAPEKRKKKSNILRESKLLLSTQAVPSKPIVEKPQQLPKTDTNKIKKSDIENVALKNVENIPSDSEKSIPLKKRAKRRKAINRTGFPSIKKKKKKLSVSSAPVSLSSSSDLLSSESIENLSSAFERVPKDGEAMNIFLERTTKYKTGDLKVVLNKDDCPKQGRLSVISLDRLQGKNASDGKKSHESLSVKVQSTCMDSDNESQPLSKLSNRLPKRIQSRRKSRMSQMARKLRDVTPSSRDSSVETVKTFKRSPKSRETSIDTIKHIHDQCEDPLPLNEKEIDFEKSIDVISKNIINKKRVMSSRDDSPASSVEGFKISEKERLKRNPRLRKKYLVAGLFSDYYKTNDPKPVDPKMKFTVNLSDFPKGLLAPPPYCERWVRQRKQHFQLPYDIWWQYHYNHPVPSWNYRKIRTNVYYDVKPSSYGCEAQACNCSPSSGCPDDCINRLVYSECSSQMCPCKELCKNQRIQKHDWAPGLEKFMTESKGWGVRTKQSIKTGEFILEYVGEVVSDKEFKERMAWRYARDTHHYCLHLDGGLVIDGHRMGGDGRFVNHSCMPNCEMQKWSANGTFRMALFALRDIRSGEELTYDYNFSLFNPAEGQPCKCDSENCRGVIGGKSQRIAKQPQPSKLTPSSQSNSGSSSSVSGTGQTSSVCRVGRPRKASKASKKGGNVCDLSSSSMLKYQQQLSRLWMEPQPKPLTPKEKFIVRDRHCFLIRNIEKVKNTRDRMSISGIGPGNGLLGNLPSSVSGLLPTNPTVSVSNTNPSVFLTRLNTPRPSRGAKTRRSANAVDTPEITKKTKLNEVFKKIYNSVVAAKDEKGDCLCTPLLKRRLERSSQGTTDSESVPRNLSQILSNIEEGIYVDVAHFDTEINALFSDVVRTQGRLSQEGLAALHLKKMYNNTKLEFAERLSEIIGPEQVLPVGFMTKRKPEEVIMCVCGLHFEEGLMVQCGGDSSERGGERGCGVWQHAHCMQVQDTTQPYYCHKCQPRKVNLEIPLDEYTDEGHQFYLSLMRGDLQVRQGDTVYVLRDIPIDAEHPDRSKGEKATTQQSVTTRRIDKRRRLSKEKRVEKQTTNKNAVNDKKATNADDVPKHTYKTIGEIAVTELDIFRVERLWKHKDTAERYVYGHHYLRPHETYHEPTRKFFPNEVMRVPLYEAVPIDLVMSQCWVLDLNTFCKGRPVGAVEQHVYISELRVDRSARLFTKISRPKYPICTKSYAFDTFPQRIKISRTYAPHEVSPEFLKSRGRAATIDKERLQNQDKEKEKEKTNKDGVKNKPAKQKASQQLAHLMSVAHSQPKNREMQKARLNGILLGLLGRLPTKQPLDVSYLLEGRRQRKKMQSS